MCLVCKQSLHRMQSDGTENGAAIKKWLYCAICDRMQRIP